VRRPEDRPTPIVHVICLLCKRNLEGEAAQLPEGGTEEAPAPGEGPALWTERSYASRAMLRVSSAFRSRAAAASVA